METIRLQGYVMKTKEGEWKLSISKNDLTTLKLGDTYFSNLLNKEQYSIYSFLTYLGIDLNPTDNKYYHYSIEGDEQNIYCIGHTENCIRAGMVDIFRKYNTTNKLSFTKVVEYKVYSNIMEENKYSNIFITNQT